MLSWCQTGTNTSGQNPLADPRGPQFIILHQSRVHIQIHTKWSYQITSLEEVDRLSPALVLRHRQGCCDVATEAVKAMVDQLGITRVHHVIVKPPIQGTLHR